MIPRPITDLFDFCQWLVLTGEEMCVTIIKLSALIVIVDLLKRRYFTNRNAHSRPDELRRRQLEARFREVLHLQDSREVSLHYIGESSALQIGQTLRGYKLVEKLHLGLEKSLTLAGIKRNRRVYRFEPKFCEN